MLKIILKHVDRDFKKFFSWANNISTQYYTDPKLNIEDRERERERFGDYKIRNVGYSNADENEKSSIFKANKQILKDKTMRKYFTDAVDVANVTFITIFFSLGLFINYLQGKSNNTSAKANYNFWYLSSLLQ